ncbi:unnamed protein product [Pipistrellus nathusii]|uniref:Calponin-homology (CH) domain-containing protein n=1 Tax=Pipistrellus nathusii TaxID=59473 RepID=A0ABP0A1G1_PIPNA
MGGGGKFKSGQDAASPAPPPLSGRRVCRGSRHLFRGARGAMADPPPVLILSHFCPRPFVCFGALRPGASRARPLAVLNPNAEPAAVALPRGPAERGFQVRPRAFRLQPKEKIVISVIWTPVKEGRVREVLTFVVNDILKHEVILLGNAEEPRKKKRSLWDTIKRKKAPASSGHKKRIPNIPSVNQTFSVPPKADRVRSPLQACENLGANEGCAPTASDSLILQENRIPISPISPAPEECPGDACLPLRVRRSTAYPSLQAPVSGQLWALGGAPACQEFDDNVTPESSLDSLTDDVNGPMEEAGKHVLTPNCPSTWGVARSHGGFLSPGSFVRSSHRVGDKPVTCVSPDVFPKAGSRPRPVEPDTTPGTYRAILSPDSFLKDNYGLSQKLEPESANPFVSPNQFVRENLPHLAVARPTCQLSPLSKENSQAPPSPPGQKENEDLPLIPGGRASNSPEAIFEEPAALEAMPDGSAFTKRKRPGLPAAPAAAGPDPGAQPPRRPILSATVTKPRPPGPRAHTDAGAPRARRCLRSAVGGCVSPADDPEDDGALHPPLPVIDPAGSSSPGSRTAPPAPQTALAAARKRKSWGSGEAARGALAGPGPPEGRESKRTHFCPPEPRTSTAKKARVPATPGPQGASSRRSLLRARADSLAFKTPNSKTHRRTPRMVPVAQASLTFIKRLKTDIPRHPMPFAAKNVFYDERWKEKQQRGLTWWLNFLLTPDHLAAKTHVPTEVNAATLLLGAESHHKPSVARAPTKEEASLRAYTARRPLSRLRHAACRLFTADGMVQAIRKLEGEIAARRLAVRRDRRLWKDVGERQRVLNWLLAYNPLWLRIGLETVFGELIALEDNSDVTGLAVFILGRLLWNPDIAAEYRHPSVPHLYRDGHEEALSAFTLKKFVLLVCFLDRAKLSRLIDHDPCLFCRDAEFKASRDVLLAFSRSFLSGEGDLCRRLSGLGLPVSHVQTPLDEFDFAVTNLAVDLQCGARLVRATELLTGDWGLSRRLRMPAVSRLQKVHNVDLALQALRARGVSLQDEQGSAILAKDIVDRHREKTLALLWRMALAFQVDVALNADELKEEIEYLKRAWRAGESSPAPSGRADTSLRERTDRERPESVRLLLEWARAVCAFYGAQVDNFTVSFSDGRLLCYLIHHYHPGCVPLAAIRQRTSQTVECAQSGSVVLNSSSESEESGLDLSLRALELRQAGTAPAELHRELLENERRNFQLVSSAARDLGGIPAMVQHADMSNTIPDEKVVITYLSFLCARLLDLRRESRAARRIQAAWREHRLRVERRRRQERDRAASVIQAAVRGFLARRRRRREARAALAVQRRWRALCRRRAALRAERERQERARNQAASVIQRRWRGFSARRRFLRLRHCSVVLQARRRMVAAVAAHRRRLRATVTIQRRWRACVKRRRDQQRYRALRAACLVLQAAFRRRQRRQLRARTRAAATLQRAFRAWRARRRAREERAATAIQAWYRARRAARRYCHIRACAVLLQARFRGLRARRLYRRRRASVLAVQRRWRALLQGRAERARFLQARAAALRLQAHWRRRRERARFLSLRETAVRLQALVRRHQQRRRFRRVRSAALVVQARFRARVAARSALAAYRETRAAVLVLQAAWRGLRARRTFLRARTSAVTIQSHYRAHAARRSFLRLRHAAVRLQAFARGHLARRRLGQQRAAAVTLQASFRMRAARRRFLRVRQAALVIQRHYRARQARLSRRRHRQVLRAATRLQAVFRGHRVRQLLRRQAAAACTIQAAYRGHRARQLLRRQAAAACTIQAAYRGHRARQLLRRQSAAACTIQAAFRGHRERARFRAVLRAAVAIQRRYRARTAARDRRARAVKARTAALTLQAAYRGWKVRAQGRRERRAARRIQAAFRTARARRRFQRLRAAALVLQRRWRARAAGRRQRAAFTGRRRAALTLQAAWRGRTARRRYAACRAAAAAIQRWYRQASAARQQRRDFLRLQDAAVRVQAAFRGLRARRQLQCMHRAAAAIQAAFRMHRAQGRFRRARAAALVVQRRFRARRRGRAQRARFVAVLRAVRVLQARWRGARARRTLRRAQRAAVLIQRCYRRHRARTAFLRRRDRAAATLQAAVRGWLARKRLRELRRAAAVLQAAFRTHRAQAGDRALQQASVLVQRRDRACRAARLRAEGCVGQGGAAEVLPATPEGAKAGQALREQLGAAVLTRRAHRRHRQRLPHQQLWGAPTEAQEGHGAKEDGALGPRALQKAAASAQAGAAGERSLEQRPAARTVQPRLRGARTRTRPLHSRAAVVAAPRRRRGAPGRPSSCSGLRGPRDLDRRRQAPRALGAGERAAPRARASLRVAVCPGRSVRRRRAVVPLPLALRARRAWRARRRVLPRRGAAVTGQNRRRARASARLRRRERSRVSSAIVIQAWARGFLQRRRLQEVRASALTIQAAWRSYRARRQVRAEQAACRIQAWFRGWRARREYRAVLKAVRAVQGRFRARQARARVLSVRAAAVTLQGRRRATLSGRRAREHLLAVQTAERRAGVRLLRWAAAARCHLAAARIQRAYRRHAGRRLRAAICIQRWFRARLRLQRFMHIRHSIVAIQHQVQVQARGRQRDRAASVIQAAVRRFLLRRKQERLGRAAVKIQALWRGHALRRRSGCPRLAAVRTSLRALSGAVREEDRLSRRTALALHHLLTYRHLSAVLEALRHLEVATRLSPRCCEDLAQSGALRQLFLLIRSCNRSVPCMEVVSYAVQVLLHVAKYERTVAAVSAVDGCVDTLLGLLRVYREKPGDRLADKSGDIFTRTCCLLAALLRATGPATEAQVRSKVAGCVSSIYRLTAQKHRADSERTLPGPSHNSSASLPRLPESPARARPVARLQPDWVLRREAGQEITTPLQAAQLVMDTLGLPYP